MDSFGYGAAFAIGSVVAMLVCGVARAPRLWWIVPYLLLVPAGIFFYDAKGWSGLGGVSIFALVLVAMQLQRHLRI
jgi:hypothetical protein